jgi:hypothetical protein
VREHLKNIFIWQNILFSGEKKSAKFFAKIKSLMCDALNPLGRKNTGQNLKTTLAGISRQFSQEKNICKIASKHITLMAKKAKHLYIFFKSKTLPVVFRRQRPHADAAGPSCHAGHPAVPHPHGGSLAVVAELIGGAAAERRQVLAVGLAGAAAARAAGAARGPTGRAARLPTAGRGGRRRSVVVEAVVGGLLVVLRRPVLVVVGGRRRHG